MKSLSELKLESAFEVLAKKFNTGAFEVALAYATGNDNVVSMVEELTGLSKTCP